MREAAGSAGNTANTAAKVSTRIAVDAINTGRVSNEVSVMSGGGGNSRLLIDYDNKSNNIFVVVCGDSGDQVGPVAGHRVLRSTGSLNRARRRNGSEPWAKLTLYLRSLYSPRDTV